MTVAVVALAAAVSLSVALLIGDHLRRVRDPTVPDALRAGETVIVNTPRPDDQSIRGVVVRDLGTGVELARAELLQPDGSALEIDGGAWVERPFAYVQLLTTAPLRPLSDFGEAERRKRLRGA